MPVHDVQRCIPLLMLLLGMIPLSAADVPLRLHLETDRPLYHIGDPVLTRIIAVDALTRAPRAESTLQIEIVDPREQLVASLSSGAEEAMKSGMFGLRWATNTRTRGGTYTVRVRVAGQAEAPWSSRTFHIADHRQQRVSAQIIYVQDSVAPGETLDFSVDATALNEHAAQPTHIRVNGVVDGLTVLDQAWEAGGAGKHAARITIPAQVRLGGSLAVTIEDDRGGSTTVARSLPIAVSGVQVETRIPGGGLVAGLPARVYAQARLPDGRPASLQARILNAAGESVAELHSEHEGRGRSTFTPRSGDVYRLRIEAPPGVDDIVLAPVQAEGASLHGSSDAQVADAPISLQLAASSAQTATLAVRRAGIVLHQQEVDLTRQPQELRIDGISADGVLDAELRNAAGELLATRRLFRHPRPGLQLHWIDAPSKLREGDTATMILEVRNAQGQPVPDALVSLRLREAGITGLRAQRDRHPSFTSMLLLEQEVADFADPEVYLDGDAAADRRLDLLLSCQGLAVVPAAPVDLDEVPPEGVTRVQPDQDLSLPVASRRDEAVSSGELGGQGSFMAVGAVGAGGGAAGMFGNRGGGARRRALGIFGGNRASESAVEAALRLFARIQEADGRWRVGEIPAPEENPGPSLLMPAGITQSAAADVALTALITHGFISSSYDHRTPNKHRRVVSAALQWLTTQGLTVFSPNDDAAHVEHLALLALPIVEAYGCTNDPALRLPAQTLITRLLGQQLHWQDRWLGWGQWETDEAGNRYPIVDARLTLQVALTLRSAESAGLDIHQARQTRTARNQTSLLALGESLLAGINNGNLPRRWSPARPVTVDGSDPLIALRLAAIFNLTAHTEAWAAAVAGSGLPERGRLDLRDLLWASEGLMILSRQHWPNWNQRLRDPLIQRQRRDDSAWDGLWAIPGPINDTLGPLASTAIATNVLQVYYRYLPHDWLSLQRHPQQWSLELALQFCHLHLGRQHAHRREATWLWSVGKRSDARGQISLPIHTVEAHGEWELSADALDQQGRLGQLHSRLAIRRALVLQMRLPHRLVDGDTVSTTLVVDGPAERSVVISGTHLSQNVTLNREGQARIPLQFRATGSNQVAVRVSGQSDTIRDHLDTTIAVVQRDSPWHGAASGLVATGQDQTHPIWIPQHLTRLNAALRLPRPMSERAAATHAALIRTPSGCFEQTSSTTYPLALAHSRANTPEHRQRSLDALKQGYARLLAFECAGGGFEWFGRGEGHAGLTAFGLVQFHDLAAAGLSVDPGMLQRTRRWLLSRIDPSTGAVQPSGQPSLHGWDEAGALLDLYVAWTLACSDGAVPPALLRRLPSLTFQGAWQHSVAAEIWARLGSPEPARQALAAITWGKDHLVEQPGIAILRSDATSLRVDASARALISGLLLGDPVESWLPVYQALLGHERHGRFGSTQATVQTLRALTMVEDRLTHDDLVGTLTLISTDGSGRDIAVGPNQPTSVAIGGLRTGSNQLRLTWQGNGSLCWTLDLAGYLEHPDNPADVPLELIIAPLPEAVRLGDAVDLQLRVIAHQATPTPMARLGLPAGLLPRPEQLDELVAAGSIAAWDTHGPHLVLYWRQLPAGEHRLSIATIADVAGVFRGVASSIQPYYQEDLRHWQSSINLRIRSE